MNSLHTLLLTALLICVYASNSQAQLLNGSFETADSIATFSGWKFTCADSDSSENTPLNSGKWSLRQTSGNTQGCFPGYVYQTIPQADSGEIWKLEGWARIDSFSQPFSAIGIHLAKIDSQGTIHLLKGDTTSNTAWTLLSLTDTVELQAGDTLVALLDPGMTGGPALGLAYFDNLSLDSLGISTGIFKQKQIDWIQLGIRPHPLSHDGWLQLSLDKSAWISLELFNVSGQPIQSLAQGRFRAGTYSFRIDVSSLPPSIYLVYLHTPEGIVRRKLVVRR